MSEQLYRQTVHTDGDRGHWYAYEPAIELVRCRECMHYMPECTYLQFHSYLPPEMVYRPGRCDNPARRVDSEALGAPTEPDGFCAWGEGRHGMDR